MPIHIHPGQRFPEPPCAPPAAPVPAKGPSWEPVAGAAPCGAQLAPTPRDVPHGGCGHIPQGCLHMPGLCLPPSFPAMLPCLAALGVSEPQGSRFVLLLHKQWGLARKTFNAPSNTVFPSSHCLLQGVVPISISIQTIKHTATRILHALGSLGPSSSSSGTLPHQVTSFPVAAQAAQDMMVNSSVFSSSQATKLLLDM